MVVLHRHHRGEVVHGEVARVLDRRPKASCAASAVSAPAMPRSSSSRSNASPTRVAMSTSPPSTNGTRRNGPPT